MEPVPSTPDTQIPYAALSQQAQQARLKELAGVFLRLGAIAFGGPAAHVALMEREIVDRRAWMSREQLLDLLGITNLIPGPNSTELAIHIGLERAGWRGLVVAGVCFIGPAMAIVWVLAALYVHYQTLPQLSWLLYGVKPVMIAIVLQALWKFLPKAAKNLPTGIAIGVALVGYLIGLNEIALLLGLGLVVMIVQIPRSRSLGVWWPVSLSPVWTHMDPIAPLASTTLASTTLATTTLATGSIGWVSVFGFFLKIGCVLYGSGYVLLAFLQRDLVDRYGWLTSQQLLDAVAIGQLTPGPVLTTATFVGYLLAGNAGAIAGTIGIFLPAFGLVWIVNPWVPQLRRSKWASSFLDGVNAASLGLMAGVTYTLGQTALVDGLTVGVAIAAAIGVLRFKLNSTWLVLAGGAIGLCAYILGWK